MSYMFLKPDDTHWSWSVSTLASSEQDMHDVSEMECHARGSRMERGIKEERDDWWSEINKRESYTTVGWRETGGLKVLGRKRDKDGKGGSREKGISTWRLIERDYFWMSALHTLSTGIEKTDSPACTHTVICCGKGLLDSCRDMIHSIHMAVPQHIQTDILCCLSTGVAGILTFPWQKAEDLRVLLGCVKGVRGRAALNRSAWYSTGKQWVIACLLQQR